MNRCKKCVAQAQHASISWGFTFNADVDSHSPTLERENIRNDWLLLFRLFCLQTLLTKRSRECLAQIRARAWSIFKRTI